MVSWLPGIALTSQSLVQCLAQNKCVVDVEQEERGHNQRMLTGSSSSPRKWGWGAGVICILQAEEAKILGGFKVCGSPPAGGWQR